MPRRGDDGPLIRVPEKLGFLFNPPLGSVRYRGAWGGRGSAKSWTFAQALLLKAAERPLRVLCARELQSSIQESVLHLLEEQIGRLGLSGMYRVLRSEIIGRNGSEFIFKGLRRNVNEIKSTEGIDVCWVEEAQAVSESSWLVLIPTIRKPGSEIWLTFNPDREEDPTYQRFVIKPPSSAIIRKVGYRDNPWLPDVLLDEANELLARDPEAYETVWGGEPWRRSDAEVLNGKWQVDEFTPGTPAEGWDGPYYGADWGFSNDPTMLIRLWIRWSGPIPEPGKGDPPGPADLMIEYEAGGIHLDNDQTARVWEEVPDSRRHRIWADSARPETINEMVKRGYRVEGAPKWTGSVLDGIAHLRTYRHIVIHPRCPRTAREARLWRYKTDKQTGVPLPDLVDGNEHTWDATRYALSPRIRRQPMRAVWYPGMEEPRLG